MHLKRLWIWSNGRAFHSQKPPSPSSIEWKMAHSVVFAIIKYLGVCLSKEMPKRLPHLKSPLKCMASFFCFFQFRENIFGRWMSLIVVEGMVPSEYLCSFVDFEKWWHPSKNLFYFRFLIHRLYSFTEFLCQIEKESFF